MTLDAPLFLAGLGISSISFLLIAGLALVLSSYVKIITVLSILRVGLGVNSLPSVLVTSGLALVLSFFVMFPTLEDSASAARNVLDARRVEVQVVDTKPANTEIRDAKISNTKAFELTDEIRAQALSAGIEEWKKFLKRHAHSSEVESFSKLALRLDEEHEGIVEKANETAQLPPIETTPFKSQWRVLAPAFFVSELKEAFATGLSLFLPFLVIDLLVANILVAVGLVRMDPAYVALPFKLLLFVLLDGWALITNNLVATYLA